jgi:hypothetical protein
MLTSGVRGRLRAMVKDCPIANLTRLNRDRFGENPVLRESQRCRTLTQLAAKTVRKRSINASLHQAYIIASSMARPASSM